MIINSLPTVPAMPSEPEASRSRHLSLSPFRSFWMGGYEGADHVNAHGQALDMAWLHGHVDHLEDDHARAASLGLHTVRESIGWRLAEPLRGRYDFGRLHRIAHSARRHGLQVVWTLMHYGIPADLSYEDDALPERFARFAAAVAQAIGTDGPAPVFNLVNEIGFLAWAISESDLMCGSRLAGGRRVDGMGSGFALKRRLVDATLQATHAVRRVCAHARFIQIEPVVHVVAPRESPELAAAAQEICDFQWQVWDLLDGRLEPSLGGSAQMLDMVGVNHYASGQWELGTLDRLAPRADERWQPMGPLLQRVWQRYRRQIVITETSHVGEGRAGWLHEIASEALRARRLGVPLEGICLYPLVDRPDWNDAGHWHNSGLWDVAPEALGERRLCREYAQALAQWQRTSDGQASPADAGIGVGHGLIAFSHLRWDFVRHRPRHLLSRLATPRRRLLFVEETVPGAGPDRLECSSRGPHIDVLVPHLREPVGHGFESQRIWPLLEAFLDSRDSRPSIAWLTTPMARPLAARLRAPVRLLYDCFDEMSAFGNAPASLVEHEHALLQQADLVISAGPALQAKCLAVRADAHCAANAADTDLFVPAAAPRRPSRPVLGYAGVIDERIDYGLLQMLVARHPEWDFDMVGPVVKVDATSLPVAPNLRWVGARPYEALPALVASWSVSLVPFHLDGVARMANPLKVLESLACGVAVVATRTPDLISQYGDLVHTATDHEGFVRACESVIAIERSTSHAAALARERADAVASRHWDQTAAAIEQLLATAHAGGPA